MFWKKDESIWEIQILLRNGNCFSIYGNTVDYKNILKDVKNQRDIEITIDGDSILFIRAEEYVGVYIKKYQEEVKLLKENS
jgi:hypothetical protein